MQWRGAMLDVSRHFFDRSFVERLLDSLAIFDYNVLQLHLTDDQGWRIELEKYPLLHQIGSKRSGSQVNHSLLEPEFDGIEHAGYFTKDDLTHLVNYASRLGIEIIPEINVPGHTGALLAAYPEYAVNREPREVTQTWGISNNVLTPLPQTLSFLREVFREVAQVFPSKYIHVGGDEAKIENWLRDPNVVSFMQTEGFKDLKELFSFFMHEIEKIVNSFGKTMITWDDAFAISPELATNAVVMSWRGSKIARRAIEQGKKVIESPVIPLYFDYSYEVDPKEPLAIGGPISTADVLNFKRQPESFGVQFQLWTEYISNPQHAEYMLWPRAAALAFANWSDKTDFAAYYRPRLEKLRNLGVLTRDDAIEMKLDRASLGIGQFHEGYSIESLAKAVESSAQAGEIALSFDEGSTN